MNKRVTEGYPALTEREKQTLRLIVRGHDAKSIARSLDLSVHTVNERLRDARRKLAVSSSREAARMLLGIEGGSEPFGPDFLGDMKIREAVPSSDAHQEAAPIRGAGWPRRLGWTLSGVTLMTLALGLLALLALPQSASAPPHIAASAQPTDDTVAQTARHWLELGDQARWEDGYRGMGFAFRKLNTLQAWIAVSQKVRVPLGAVVSRVLIDRENLPAPPYGYEVVKFRTTFANRADVVETVTLEEQAGSWGVVGIVIS